MNVKTIKGIENEKWMRLKLMAVKNGVSMGKLVSIMIEDFSKRADAIWESILSQKRILSDKESEEIEKRIAKLRKNGGFRV